MAVKRIEVTIDKTFNHLGGVKQQCTDENLI